MFREFGRHLSFVMKSGQLVRSQFCALRAVRAGEPSVKQPAIALKE